MSLELVLKLNPSCFPVSDCLHGYHAPKSVHKESTEPLAAGATPRAVRTLPIWLPTRAFPATKLFSRAVQSSLTTWLKQPGLPNYHAAHEVPLVLPGASNSAS